MISIIKINNEVVKPIIVHGKGFEIDKRPIKGEKLFSELYANIFICAKKFSGKTVVATKIIKDTCDKNTTVLVFCSTVDKDMNHKKIKQLCKNKGIPYLAYSSMVDEGVNILEELIKKLQQEAEQEESGSDEDVPEEKTLKLFNDYDSDEEPIKRKSKYRTPEYLIFIDDLSNELKSPVLVKLLKMNRHFKAKIIISSQYINDLLPESLKQMDYCLVFKGMSEEKLQKIYKDFDISVNIDVFNQIYKHATEAKYSFLFIDIRQKKFRMNFQHEYSSNF